MNEIEPQPDNPLMDAYKKQGPVEQRLYDINEVYKVSQFVTILYKTIAKTAKKSI